MAYVDHVVIAVRDLDEAASRWQDATGVEFARGGRHPGGTENCLGVLGDQQMYLELITVTDPASRDGWAALARDRVGLLTWAIGTDDIDRDIGRLAAYGIVAGPADVGSRRCPDGTTVTWRSSVLGDLEATCWPFLIEWPAAGPARLGIAPAPARRHLTAMTVPVREPDRLAAALTGALGLAPGPGDGLSITDGEVVVGLDAASAGRAAAGSLEFLAAGSAGARSERRCVTLDGLTIRIEAEPAPA